MPADAAADRQWPVAATSDTPYHGSPTVHLTNRIVVVMVVTDHDQIGILHPGSGIPDARAVGIEEHPIALVLQKKAAVGKIIETHWVGN
jgi:hypothetical protein